VVHHRERIANAKPAIYVSNHCSTLDAFIAIWLCPVGGCGVVIKEIAHIPFFGWLYLLSGHLRVDRSDRTGAVAALQSTAAVVRKYGLSMWIWPEGTRSRSGRLLPLKKGFVHLAIATGLPVVPVVVHGAHKNWEKHTFTLNPVTIGVHVLPSIDTSSWRVETTDAHCAEVHRAFAAALPPDQQPDTPQPAVSRPSAP
jgi:1-acyl-sn-glycerol-3-phosphate acyltransferase